MIAATFLLGLVLGGVLGGVLGVLAACLVAVAKTEPPAPEQIERASFADGCDCLTCQRDGSSDSYFLARMALCPECGNKRCPKATNHRLQCTGINDPGQPGSAYQ